MCVRVRVCVCVHVHVLYGCTTYLPQFWLQLSSVALKCRWTLILWINKFVNLIDGPLKVCALHVWCVWSVLHAHTACVVCVECATRTHCMCGVCGVCCTHFLCVNVSVLCN